MSIEIQLKAHAESVNARLDELLPPAHAAPAKLHEAMRYSCLAPGKRLRPALCVACCEFAGGSIKQALDAACAIEMVHCFSLIHDDLPAIDDDDLRRGLPTCHRQFGEAIAILAGDALFSLAFQLLASPKDPSNPGRALQCVGLLTRAAGSDGLVGGEVADVLSEGVEVDRQNLEFIHSRKTGALMSAACEIGGVLAGAPADVCHRLKVYGEKVGLAFQITDDVLNETSDPRDLGKAVGSDRKRSKATYTVQYGLEGARQKAREAVDQAKALLGSEATFLSGLAEFSIGRLR